MRKVSIFLVIYICGFLGGTMVEAGQGSPGTDDDITSKILVTSKVVEALGKIGNPQARDVLVKALESKEFFIRAYAAQALGRIQDKESIPLLKNLIDDDNYLVRILASVALFELGQKDMQESLIAYLKDEDSVVRAAAARELGGLGEQFLQALNEMLSTETEYLVRVNIIGELEEEGFNLALPLIRQALEDSNPQVRSAACSAIGKFEDKESIPQILQRLDDEEPLVRANAGVAFAILMRPEPKVALAGLGEDPRILALRKQMDAEEPVLEAASYVALAILGDVGILPILLEKINAPDSLTIIRTKVAKALKILKPHIARLTKGTSQEGENLQNISLLENVEFEYQVEGNSLLLIFTEALIDSKNPLNQDAPLVLKEFANRIALPALREALSVDDPDLVATTAYVLGEFKDTDAFKYLIKVFDKYGI